MKRIAIIGCGGAGKSTLAKQLGERLELPVLHLDKFYWRPHWTVTPKEEWAAIHDELCGRPAWIIDGNYNGTMERRLAACDAVVFLDFPGWRCLGRALKRYWSNRNRSRDDIAAECIERIDTEFLRWIWNFRRDVRPRILDRLARVEGQKDRFILQSPREVGRFLDTLDPPFPSDR